MLLRQIRSIRSDPTSTLKSLRAAYVVNCSLRAAHVVNCSLRAMSSYYDGVVYSIVKSPDHKLEDHVERPSRIDGILNAMSKSSSLINNNPQLHHIPPTRIATDSEISLIHSYLPDLRKKASKAKTTAPIAVADIGDPDGVTFMTTTTLNDACKALGATLDLADKIMTHTNNDTTNNNTTSTTTNNNTTNNTTNTINTTNNTTNNTRYAFSIVRPPGHHATPKSPLGYCIFNNIAITAKYLQQHHNISKIAIIDFDVHNGNGTCEAFWEDSSIFVIDIHEENTVYPSPEFIPSDVLDIGGGDGRGYTMNIPLPRYAGHECVVRLFEHVVLPALHRFEPEVVLISAGYDAHVLDPFQLLQYTSSTYYYMVQQLKYIADRYCHGRMLLVLEGGYNVDALGESVVETFHALLVSSSSNTNTNSNSNTTTTNSNNHPLPKEEPVDVVDALIVQLKQIHAL